MLQIIPDYYEKFQCIADACRHNCCIGWEIDIDEETAASYRAVPGGFGVRLQENIIWPDEEDPENAPAQFRLGAGERCPFLNKTNLCDVIQTLGETSLCEICREHPRFHNVLGERRESGVGLCCEAAGRLILGQASPVAWLDYEVRGVEASKVSGGNPQLDEEELAMLYTTLGLRDDMLRVLQERSLPIWERARQMLATLHVKMMPIERKAAAAFLMSLERLDEAWTGLLEQMGELPETDGAFDRYMAERQTEYEQFMVYLLYRHFAKSQDEWDWYGRAGFVVFGCEVLRALGEVIWHKTGSFSFESQVELARLFSSEIEYSEENLEAVFAYCDGLLAEEGELAGDC